MLPTPDQQDPAAGFLADARILVVDDEPANTTILERLLHQAGYPEVAVTNISADATALYESFRPDLVLLDLHMPKPDGYELLGAMADPAGAGIRPPVVVLTADATRPARERALSLGAADFLTKPLDHLEVLLRIRTQLRTRYLQLELLAQNADLERAVAERTVALRDTIDRLEVTALQRHRLAEALVTAQEAERRRIAADIHDDPVQAMVATAMQLELVERRASDPALVADLASARSDVSAAVASLRELIFRLAPSGLDREGLEAALRESVERQRQAREASIDLDVRLAREPEPNAAVVAFRIIQEALTNAIRHAQATRIRIEVATDGVGIHLAVADDGVGFDPPPDPGTGVRGHYGLAAMAQRAELAGGWLRIETGPGLGTTVSAWIGEEGQEANPDA